MSEDGRTASLDVKDLLEFDRLVFLGNADIPTRLSFHIEYTRDSGPPHWVRPAGGAYGPNQWSGAMWNAKAKGRFSAAYVDGSGAWSGTIDSEGAPDQTVLNGIVLPFGHMGFEANGRFASPIR